MGHKTANEKTGTGPFPVWTNWTHNVRKWLQTSTSKYYRLLLWVFVVISVVVVFVFFFCFWIVFNIIYLFFKKGSARSRNIYISLNNMKSSKISEFLNLSLLSKPRQWQYFIVLIKDTHFSQKLTQKKQRTQMTEMEFDDFSFY